VCYFCILGKDSFNSGEDRGINIMFYLINSFFMLTLNIIYLPTEHKIPNTSFEKYVQKYDVVNFTVENQSVIEDSKSQQVI
jgi:hypothetical protein